MSRKDRFELLLKAFARDLERPPSQEELDRIYTTAIADGLLTESDVERGFERLLNRPIETRRDRSSPAPELAERPTTVGDAVRAYRTSQGLAVEQLAGQLQVSREDVIQLETAEDRFDEVSSPGLAKKLAADIPGLSPAATQRFLQRVRVTLQLRETTGPALRAARRPKQE